MRSAEDRTDLTWQEPVCETCPCLTVCMTYHGTKLIWLGHSPVSGQFTDQSFVIVMDTATWPGSWLSKALVLFTTAWKLFKTRGPDHGPGVSLLYLENGLKNKWNGPEILNIMSTFSIFSRSFLFSFLLRSMIWWQGHYFSKTIVKYKTHLFYILSAMEIFFIFILADVCLHKSLLMVSVLFNGWALFVFINIIVLLRWTTR